MYEHLFYQSTQSDQYLLIDSLKVDLGTVSTSDFKNHFFELLEEKLIIELKNKFETVSDSKVFEEALRNEPEPAKKPDPIIYSTESQQNTEALVIFLQSGNFPWWYKKTNGKTPAQILNDFTSNEQINFLLALITKARSLKGELVKQIVKRLYIQLHESAYETYLTELTKLFSEASLASNVKTVIEQKVSFTKLFNISVRDFYEQAVVFVLLNKDEPDFLKSFLVHLQRSFSVTTDELHERVKENPLQNLNVESLLNSNKDMNEDKANAPSLSSTNKSIKPVELDEGLYVSNAGLVILHPFLSTFFKGLNLLNEENQFTSVETQTKAAVLLYYLQCGLVEYKEWEMPLNKILCGMATEELIPDDIILSDYEKEESILLLQSVIEYWTALKGASIEALQTTFFVREGKVTFKENHWLVQVERTGVDILLDRLPWGIGTIKLPWLKEIMYIEW
ncbi:MAG: hypothetical protein JWQ25_3157 [Daejeonella sp.]|nr:hypothetical protein [Daejeonella sp.]